MSWAYSHLGRSWLSIHNRRNYTTLYYADISLSPRLLSLWCERVHGIAFFGIIDRCLCTDDLYRTNDTYYTNISGFTSDTVVKRSDGWLSVQNEVCLLLVSNLDLHEFLNLIGSNVTAAILWEQAYYMNMNYPVRP